jgi:hypothetical protein
MSWEDVFEIPLPPKLKYFKNSTLKAFLNIYKPLRNKSATNIRIDFKGNIMSWEDVWKILILKFLNISKALIDRALKTSELTIEDKSWEDVFEILPPPNSKILLKKLFKYF